jgi:hypothetical protein
MVKVAVAFGTGLPSPSKPIGVVEAVIVTLLESVLEYATCVAGSMTALLQLLV